MNSPFKSLIDAYKKGDKDDTVGLFQIISHMKRDLNIQDEEVLEYSLNCIKAMLVEGYKAGDSPDCHPWKNQDPIYVADRVKTEWQALGRTPNIGDIVYFGLPGYEYS